MNKLNFYALTIACGTLCFCMFLLYLDEQTKKLSPKEKIVYTIPEKHEKPVETYRLDPETIVIIVRQPKGKK